MKVHSAIVFATLGLNACTSEKIQYVARPFVQGGDTANGFLGYFTVSDKQTNCGNCHVGIQASWKTTKHAQAWADLQGSGHAQTSCNGCHSVSELGNRVGHPAGYKLVADAAYQDVQCESCHGPGFTHASSPTIANVPLASIHAGARRGAHVGLDGGGSAERPAALARPARGERGILTIVKARSRHPMLVRSFAAAVALAAAAQGGGVPMCASLLAEAAAPCAMHSSGVLRAHDPGVATLAAASAGHGACHVDAAAPGCAAGGTCPTGGTAAPAWVKLPIGPRAASLTVVAGPSSALISYLAPPLAPPPQA